LQAEEHVQWNVGGFGLCEEEKRGQIEESNCEIYRLLAEVA
jgi:hypothetical protein